MNVKHTPTTIGIKNFGVYLDPNGFLNEELVHLWTKAVRLAVWFRSETFTSEKLSGCISSLHYPTSLTHWVSRISVALF